ncbi:hypothetical protein AVEN_100243-1 [Araneus ventricosus]|uniref:Uncharacterized protein n=1 Tax=Araneus ventricosus TaxID=182803 RepID=A0A4Y2LKW5_ARAVE|nr:hypothetical protein AVEN_100243-1 [Araneus ventricosus]
MKSKLMSECKQAPCRIQKKAHMSNPKGSMSDPTNSMSRYKQAHMSRCKTSSVVRGMQASSYSSETQQKLCCQVQRQSCISDEHAQRMKTQAPKHV